MYVCIYIYIYIYICIYIYIGRESRILGATYIRTYVYVYKSHTYIQCAYTHMYTYINPMHTYIHIHTYCLRSSLPRHTYTHTYIHTFRLSPDKKACLSSFMAAKGTLYTYVCMYVCMYGCACVCTYYVEVEKFTVWIKKAKIYRQDKKSKSIQTIWNLPFG
jgi:hypothetical protein